LTKQISYLPDKKTGDIDYESKLSGDHYKPPNSDVRSGNHLAEHNKQFGKVNPLRNIPQTPKK
jgi:hypothetical protein